ncbi:Ig-like domain-containing protein [Flindersiella endophytica]
MPARISRRATLLAAASTAAGLSLAAKPPPASAARGATSPTGTPVGALTGGQADIGYPAFTGAEKPVPPEPAGLTADNTMRAIYDADRSRGEGTDFWLDRLLTRRGEDPSGDWLLTRGRAVFMKVHDPDVIGFGGQVAYWESIDNHDGYAIRFASGGTELRTTEVVADRTQAPSHWRGHYTATGLDIRVTKYVTHNNVAVTQVTLTNTSTATQGITVTAGSPYTTTAEGTELTGVVYARNNLTLLFPRLSGDAFAVDDSSDGAALKRTISLRAGRSTTFKVQLGFLTEEISESRFEYQRCRTDSPSEAFRRHVRAYNKWWADNLPYVDVPDDNIKKQIYYRWWLLRFNFLDADIPGNDYQFPTSMEGVLGYNNAIVLTIGMFVDDLKYFRDPALSYGPWVSAGEVARNARYMDNPGDPENWSNSYTQYLSESAWQAYLVHGGPLPIVENLARYAEQDTYGQLDFYDRDGNGLIEYDWGALTGNDADAVSFDWRPGRLDRAESAYVYSNALAAASAYDLLGDAEKAAAMRAIAERVRTGVLTYLWNSEQKLLQHRHVATNALVPWKEINNYYPFAVGLMPNEAEYKQALRLWADPAEYPIFPFFTANQRDKAEAAEQGHPGSNNFSVINSTVAFRFLSSVLRNYPSEYVTVEMYKQLLYWNAWAHFVDGDNNWPDQNEFWADWNAETRHIDYRSWIHHTILGATNWTVIEDVIGLRPRADGRVELWPLDIGWDHFAVGNVRYHGSDLTIVWQRPGPKSGTAERYYKGFPEGYSLYVDGRRVFTTDRLKHVVVDAGVKPVQRVRLGDARLADLFQKAGRDLRRPADAGNLAAGATPSASFTASGSDVAGAIDGFTINVPYWGSRGSGNATDWYALDFGAVRTVDDVKLYFYNDRAAGGYAEPALYRVQYDVGGEWRDVPRQTRTPVYPRSNFNHVAFPSIRTQRLRVLCTHRSGLSTGLKEIQVFRTRSRTSPPGNAAPYVVALPDPAFRRPGQVRLQGVVKDDALPTGSLSSTWSLVSGPGTAFFDSPSEPATIVKFSEGGHYVLRLTASDGALASSADVAVEVAVLPSIVNVAPFGTASASYTSPWESVAAINDDIDPPRSNDTVNSRWGTWPQQGTQWVQLEWADAVKVDSADVYFFDDGGGVLVPASWKLRYWDGSAFADVPGISDFPVAKDQYNKVEFSAVTTTRLRVELVSGGASVGLLEVKTYAVPPASIRPVHQPTLVNQVPQLPEHVTQVYADGSVLPAAATWQAITAEQVASGGTKFGVLGLVEGAGLTARATVYVRTTDAVSITFLEPEDVPTKVGVAPALPGAVLATFNDGSRDNVNTHVTWDPVDPSQYVAPGTFTVHGTVAGTSLQASATVTVLP